MLEKYLNSSLTSKIKAEWDTKLFLDKGIVEIFDNPVVGAVTRNAALRRIALEPRVVRVQPTGLKYSIAYY